MYKVVKNKLNSLYVVAAKWIVNHEGKVYSFYPPESKHKKAFAQQLSPERGDWTNEEVQVMSEPLCKYKLNTCS
jgi:ribosomal protein L24E